MRILHVTDSYAPTVGGIETLVANLAREQVARGHEVAVLSRETGATTGSTGTPDDPVRTYRSESMQLPLLRWADQVHAHLSVWSPLAIRSAEAAAVHRVPVLATLHSMLPGIRPAARLFGVARGWGGLPIQWSAVSASAAAEARRVLPGQRVLVVPNAVDVAWWGRPTPRTSVPPGDREVRVVAVMRLERRKRPLQLLNALQRTRALVPSTVPMRAVIVGGGALQPRVVRRIAGSPLAAWVTAVGPLEPTAVRDLLHRAEVFIAPSAHESFGIAALEARSAGLAIVGRTGTGLSEFVRDGANGLLADSDRDLAGAIARLASQPALLQAIMDHNRQPPTDLDWGSAVLRFGEAYAASQDRARMPAMVRSQPLALDRYPEPGRSPAPG